MRKRIALAAVLSAGTVAAIAVPDPAVAAPVTGTEHAHLAAPSRPHGLRAVRRIAPKRLRALRWAKAQSGHAYCWGGTGPCFDCSGLVYEAYRHQGYRIPRTTTEMLRWWRLRRVYGSARRRGDLAFYGTGHVELWTRWRDHTFGAHSSGQPVSFIRFYPGTSWAPTAVYHVIDSG